MKGIRSDIDQVRLGVPGVREIHGSLDGSGHRFGIVVSRFNEQITRKLLAEAVAGLLEHGVREDDIVIAWVPGAFEIPVALRRLARAGKVSALIAIGAVIEGETSHAELITGEVTHSLTLIAREFDLPVIDTILGARTWAQAEARAGEREKNRGWHGALAALEMATLLKRI